MFLPLSNLALWGGIFFVGLFTGKVALNRNDPAYAQKIEEAKARLAEQAKEGPVQPDDKPWPAEQVAALETKKDA